MIRTLIKIIYIFDLDLVWRMQLVQIYDVRVENIKPLVSIDRISHTKSYSIFDTRNLCHS